MKTTHASITKLRNVCLSVSMAVAAVPIARACPVGESDSPSSASGTSTIPFRHGSCSPPPVGRVSLQESAALKKSGCFSGEMVQQPSPLVRCTEATPGYPDRRRGSLAFEHNLLSAVQDESKGQNWVCSPLSVVVPMAMSHFGATGATQEQYRQHFSGGYEAHKHAEMVKQVLSLLSSSHSLAIFNGIYYNQSVPVKEAFCADIEALAMVPGKNSAIEIASLDYRFPETVRTHVNDTVKAHTNNLIPELLPPKSVSPDHLLTLVNALYFKGLWRLPFKKSRTMANQPFHGVRAALPSQVSMMNKQDDYYCNPSFKEGELSLATVELPLKDGFSMLLAKVNQYRDTTFCEAPFEPNGQSPFSRAELLKQAVTAVFGAQGLQKIREGMRKREIDLAIPRFQLEHTAQLKKILAESIGLERAFDASRAEFKRLATAQVWIDEVFHKAVIKINEKGCEAAAATAILFELECACVRPSIRFDSSFVGALIYTPPTGQEAAQKEEERSNQIEQAIPLFYFAVQNAPEDTDPDDEADDASSQSENSNARKDNLKEMERLWAQMDSSSAPEESDEESDEAADMVEV